MLRFHRDDFLGVGFFVHPVPIAAVFLMALNDHFLKYRYPSWWTGKLSDFCGLFFFPLFLCALIVLVVRLVSSRRIWIGPAFILTGIALTDAVFIFAKVSRSGAEIVANVLTALGFPSRVVADSTDLIALSAGIATYFFARAAWTTEAERKSST